MRSDLPFMVVRAERGWQAWELGAGGVANVAILEGSPKRGGGPVRFSLRGDLVAISSPQEPGEKGKMGVWNLRTGARAGPEFVYSTALVDVSPSFSPDGKRIALGAADGTCMIIDVATAQRLVTFATRPLVPNEVWFSPDGTHVATFNIRNEARVWDAATGEPTSPVLDAEHWWGGLRYSPDGRWLATWSVHNTTLREGRTGAPAGDSIPAGWRVVSFSRDSRSLGTADDTGFVQVWDVPSGQPFTEPLRLRLDRMGFLGSPEFSPDGRILCTETYEKFYFSPVPPRLPEGTPVPEWLLRLATVLATKTVNDAGQLVDLPDATKQFHDVRREIAALPADAPLAEWGRWILDDRADRSIAPGFTCTPSEADTLAAFLRMDLLAKP